MSVQTTEDGTDNSLPSFSTFSSELDPSWDYYDRDRSSTDVITSQSNNYTRPWEMETKDKGFEPFSKLPSFQSQFHAYSETNLVPEPSLPQITPVPVPVSPASPGNGSLTQLTPINSIQSGLTQLQSPSFHTLTAVNTRTYPLVPAPIQARDIPAINQQYLEERHIQLYQPISTFPPQNMVTVIKNEPNYEIKNGLHHSNFMNPLIDNGFDIKVEKSESPVVRCDARKKERRKNRASSLESSAESESSAMDMGDGNPGQVAAISSTASFKSPMGSMGMGEDSEGNGEKQTKKKRKRCGECIGCQKKDNCGDCAPCRNDKSHQICKQRRCEKLTDKKLIYGADGSLIRGESRRGRGKGRGGGVSRGSFRGRKALGLGSVVSPRPQPSTTSISPAPASLPQPSPNTTTSVSSNSILVTGTAATPVASHSIPQQQQISAIVPSPGHTMKEQPQQPMAPMAFYPTWQADPSQGWQNQFIQQIPQNTPAITSLNSIEFQPQGYSYQPNGYVQTGLGFEPNYGRTYATPVQRYEFQTNQMSPINQVSLQSVSFAPAVTYTSQVSTGSTPMLLSSQNDLNKTISGNDMPGYPRVNSVPPRSLNCNGYSGDYSGNQNHNLTSNVQPQQQQQQQINQHQQQQQQQQQMQHHQQQQQHNNSNQMHPPQVPQSPNRSNMSTPVSQHMMVPTGPGSNHLSQLSQSPNALQNNGNPQQIQMQSPNHHHSQLQSASRYPSHPGTPHSMQQSPNKNPQMLHSHSGMHTPNPQHNAHQHNMTAMSPNHNMNHVQEWSWNNHTVPTGNNEIFNQSDRVNLNTRLKTMILSKNDQKDHDHQNGDGSTSAANQQTSAQTGHFLSYSHHLRDINPTTNDSRCLQPGSTQITEPIGGGGESIRKPFGYNKPNDFQYTEQKLENNSVRKTDYGGTDEMKEKNVKGKGQAAQKSQNVENVKIKTEPEKVKPKRQRKKPVAKQTPTNDASNKSSNNESSHNANPRQSYSTSNYGIDHIHPPNEPMHQPPKPYYLPKENDNQTNLPVPTAYDPTIKIKQEPMSFSSYNSTTNHPVENFDLAQVKMEGYERNYQNFINYADYCQSQNATANRGGQQQQQSQSESEYPSFNPGYNYPSFSTAGYQANYSNYNQYTGQQVQQQPMNNEPVPQATKQEPYLQEQQVKTENENKIVLTNYEKEIPVYTYPNPSKIPIGDASQKSEPHTFPYLGEGGPATLTESVGFSCCRQGGTNNPSDEHLRDGICAGRQTKDELLLDDDAEKSQDGAAEKNAIPSPDRTEKGLKPEVPDCDCFSSDKNPPEPGSYYTHLGSAASLEDLRKDFEQRVGIAGRQLRIEKIVYTGKEGKTGQGCPLAKWIIRRSDAEEKILCLVKRRQGHRCPASFIVVCIVAWDGLPKYEADNAYKLLVHKLNKFGLPTTRRCATNENRTCACQGLDPESCGASFSFGCSWSMYYNGCKYARSKTVRKFRLSVKSEEPEIEEHMNILATILSPLYVNVAPKAYENQCKYEQEAPDCRLGLKHGKPFSGVTTCIDFCAHSHRDLHNMQDGCTVQVGLLRQRGPGVSGAAEDEQLHVLPLYTMDTTDEFGSADAQAEKNKTGAVQVLEKFPCEVRVRATPLQPCRRHGKKRNGKEVVEEPPPPPSLPVEVQPVKKESTKKSSKNKSKQPPASSPSPRAQTPQASNASPSTNSAFSTPINQNLMNTNSSLINMATMIDNFTDAQLQSNHISSTVLDSPYSYDYTTGSYIDNRNYYNQWPPGSEFGYPDRCEQVKSRGSEENPDSTTLSTANSAFSPKITDPSKFSLLDDGTKDQGFAKPKPPEYPPNYGYHSNKPAYSPMYPPYAPYEHYNNMDYYGNDKLRYNFYNPHHHHHQPYPQYNMYHSNPTLSAPSPTPQPNWNMYPPSPSPMPMHPMQQQMQQPSPKMPELAAPTSEPIGEITEINDNLECFQDAQMGGVGIALGHGSVLIECAKHEMHATTALRKPNRLNPTRITLIFYQHRNLNRHKHGIEEWEEKMRLKKLGITAQDVEDANKEKAIKVEEEIKEETKDEPMNGEKYELDYEKLSRDKEEVSLRAPTLTTTSWTTLFPMHPCVVTGPYQEGNNPIAAQIVADGTTTQQPSQPQQQEPFTPPKLNEAYM